MKMQELKKNQLQILAGELATQFALSMGFVEESLTTAESKEMWLEWRNNNCQPNYWTVRTTYINYL